MRKFWEPSHELMIPETPQNFGPGGQFNQVTSLPETPITANVIAPTALITKVADAGGLIKTITPPYPGFAGLLFLIAGTTPFTWDATGNIFALGTSTAAGRAMGFLFNPMTQKWHALQAA